MDEYNVKKLTPEQYDSFLPEHSLFFHKSCFNELNKNKVEEVQYLAIQKGESVRFLVCFGIQNGAAKCPFSAPCAYLFPVKKETTIASYEDAVAALEGYAKDSGWKQIRFILPPMFYAEEDLSALVNILVRHGFSFENIDVNYALDLSKVYVENYADLIHHNARKNLRIALNSNLEFIRCEDDNLPLVYDIIQKNRQGRGHPLRMTCEQVANTLPLVDHDLFLVRHENDYVASALVYRLLPGIAQVIYWADLPGYEALKSTNYISYQLIQYYGSLGYKYLDIGISTEDSVPNYGLCEFKESIGCERGLKFTLKKELTE